MTLAVVSVPSDMFELSEIWYIHLKVSNILKLMDSPQNKQIIFLPSWSHSSPRLCGVTDASALDALNMLDLELPSLHHSDCTSLIYFLHKTQALFEDLLPTLLHLLATHLPTQPDKGKKKKK